MFLTELFEEQQPNNILVVYPGRFQPFHKGHKAVYDFLVNKFGLENVFISTSDKVDPPKSPFNYSDKLQMINTTGISSAHVIKSSQPYISKELVSQYDPEKTTLLFAVSAKDMAEDPRFKFAAKKDGSPSFFQPAPADLSSAAPMSQHGYMMTVPTFDFTVLGQPVSSATQIRSMFIQGDEAARMQIIKDLYGKTSPVIYKLLSTKLMEDAAGVGVIAKNKKMAKDPRYSMSMSVDVKPETPEKQLKAFRLK